MLFRSPRSPKHSGRGFAAFLIGLGLTTSSPQASQAAIGGPGPTGCSLLNDIAVNGPLGYLAIFGPGCPGYSSGVPFLPPPTPGSTWIFPPVSLPDAFATLWLDPDVSVGYIDKVANPLGPLFDQFIAPALTHNTSYQLYSSTSACSADGSDYSTLLATIMPNNAYNFSTPLP